MLLRLAEEHRGLRRSHKGSALDPPYNDCIRPPSTGTLMPLM